MIHRIKSFVYISVAMFALASATGCKKGTFDINSPNPNTPSSVDPKYILAAALTNSAVIVAGNPGAGSTSGNDIIDCIMGYWAVSGDYSPNFNTSSMTLTPDFGAAIWNNTYPIIQNFKNIEAYYGTAATGNNYIAISKIMKSYLFTRLVDCYNNIPYTQAAASGSNAFPVYDDAQSVYKSCINQLDSAVTLIGAGANSDNPGSADVMFGGTMNNWTTLANTLKLKMLLKFSAVSGGPAYIATKITNLASAPLIGTGADAVINPGYSTNTNALLNPEWLDIGFTTTLGTGTNTSYFRACTYAVNFYKNTNDPRLALFYTPVTGTTVTGRAFGSNSGTEHNTTISAVGGNATGATQTSGYLKSPTQGSVILSAAESYFLQAEAVQRGYLTISGATVKSLYQNGVAESFRLLGVSGATAAAATYTAQSGDNVNITTSSNPLKTIILQKWAASNIYDPLEAWSDWRRTGFPADLPIPIYPGTTITHMPYRFLYPSTETSYNSANVAAQGNLTQDSKIFWMP